MNTTPEAGNNEPLVSVCLVAYNHEPYIRQALDGILSQKTDFPFEVCIGEDNSPDGTRAICQEYAEEYPEKIRLILRERDSVFFWEGKATGNHNFAETLLAARGKYVTICEGDDYWTDDSKLQTQADFLERNPDFSICFTGSKKLKRGRLRKANKHVPGEVTGLADIVKRVYMPTASVMYRNSGIDELGEVYQQVPYMDHILFCMAARNGLIKFIRKPMTVYRMHEGGIWSSLSQAERLRSRIQMREAITKLLDKSHPAEAEVSRQSTAAECIKLARLYFEDDNTDNARQYLQKALQLSPEAVLRDCL